MIHPPLDRPLDMPLPVQAPLPYDAIVIGASAGGIEALGTLLPSLPARFQAAVFVVLHLPPDTQSEVAELFNARCRLPVLEAGDKERVTGGAIYFAPAGYHAMIDANRTCALSIDEPVNFSRPSIDVLFESAAWTYGARLLGILLTGASADGAAGMAAIHAAGGQTWAQTPDTARASAMPLAAIERAVVDHVLDLDAMAARLRQHHDAARGVRDDEHGIPDGALGNRHDAVVAPDKKEKR
jgi:two-component system chemotaxis response regulator CheB